MTNSGPEAAQFPTRREMRAKERAQELAEEQEQEHAPEQAEAQGESTAHENDPTENKPELAAEPPLDNAGSFAAGPFMPLAGDPEVPANSKPRRARPSRSSVAFLVTSIVLMSLLAAISFIPVPFVVRGPGPTLDTLSTDPALITIDGATTYPTGDGQLRLTTVAISGGPDRGVALFDAIRAWLREDSAVFPRELIYPAGEEQQDTSEYQQQQMAASQDNATAAALLQLGYELDMKMTVAELMEGYEAGKYLRVDDEIKAITANGTRLELETFKQLTDLMATLEPGTPVVMEVERDGRKVTARFPTSERPEGDDRPGSLLGVWVFTEVTEFPVEVTFDIDRIGGPSAGMMFALGIVDMMTAGEMTGGVNIAGSGTMSTDGEVGPIGGIRQKLFGASRDGAEWFLAEPSNCTETVGYEPEGLRVVPVATLDDAVAAVEAIAAGEGNELPTCAAP